MALIKWTDDLSVNIKSIDDQHKVLVDIINEFYEILKISSGNEAISVLLKKVKDYTVIHFSTEEKLFAQYGYPETIAHKKEHDLFIEKVKDLETRFNAGKLLISFEVTNFLKDWLLKHIKATDKAYSSFLVSRGAS